MSKLIIRLMYLVFCGGTSILYICYIISLPTTHPYPPLPVERIICPNSSDDKLQDIPITFTHSQARSNQATRDLWFISKPAMSPKERNTTRELLALFIQFTKLHNLTYFMASGSLLGSYRHHAIMPWDDDVDLLMQKNQSNEIAKMMKMANRKEAFKNMMVRWGPAKRLKIFHRINYIPVKINIYRFGWPCLDITFYSENDTHLWQYNFLHILPKHLVFPLTTRPFEMLQVASPRDPFAVLKLLYKDPTCVSLSFSHRLERAKRAFKFDCKRLKYVYPFVHRRVVNSTVFESVRIGTCTYYEIPTTDPIYSVSKPFIFESI